MAETRQERRGSGQPLTSVEKISETSATSPRDATLIYLEETRRPFVSLIFLLPLLFIYEVGLWSFAAGQSRNGADVFLRHLLENAGSGISILLPLLACAALLAWHHLTGEAWHVRTQTLMWMTCECIAFAGILMVIAYVQRQVLDAGNSITALVEGQTAGTPPARSTAAQAIVYVGAGVYEELLFRLMLLPACLWLFRQFVEVKWQAFVWAVVASSLVFALAHYAPFNSAGEPLALATPAGVYAFSFRFLAGVFFATLFVQRGIGIAVGAHAAYDLIIFCG